MFQTGDFTADVYNALQIIIVFLTDVHKLSEKENVKTVWIQDLFDMDNILLSTLNERSLQ